MTESAVKTFGDAFRRQFGRLPVWTPGTEVQLGDVGVLVDGEWRRVTTLAHLSIDFLPESGTAAANYDLATSHGVTVSVKAAASGELEGVAPANAGIGFSFESAGAFAFSATKCTVDQMEDLWSVQRQMLSHAAKANWEKDWIVVTTTVRAERAITAVASSPSAQANLDLGAAVEPATLANATANAAFAHQGNMTAAFVTLDPTVVMFEAWRIEFGLFGGERPAPMHALSLTADFTEVGHSIPRVAQVSNF